MQLTITPKAAQRLLGFIAEKGGDLAVRIRISRSLSGIDWRMSLEPAGPDAVTVNGVPVVADKASQGHLDGMVIDWTLTPQGPGFGVYNRDLAHREFTQAAD